jgi:glyoxylase-like metal-dependent hydrolase (beta-lactamase superfamily II)
VARTYVELAPGLVRIPTFGRAAINSFAFLDDDGSVTLVDAGLKGGPRRITAALAELGRSPADVGRILLTHVHLDHASGAAALRTATSGQVHTHDAEAGFAREGRAPPTDRRSFWARVFAHLPGQGFDPVSVDGTFADGDLLPVGGGLRVVHTPGHTPGHVSFLHEGSGTLIVGDALFNALGIRYSTSFFCSDIPLSRETAARLGDLDYEVAAFAHGRELRERARERVREFLRRRR